MNYKMVGYVTAWVLKLEGFLLLFPCLIAWIYGEEAGWSYLIVSAVCILLGVLFTWKKPKNREIHVKEGFATVALSWIVLSLFGAIPFVLTKEIPFYIDAVFEIVSGFTTTGSSILTNVEALSHASLFWRSFSHWIGGMGVLVFVLMVLPIRGGTLMNLMKAESPGPDVGKMVPRVRETARILYLIYIAMTLAQIILLLCTGMHWFDTLCMSLGTAGTGGFAILNDGCASYTPAQQWIIAIFMIMFGVNFNFYYLSLRKKWKAAVGSQEVRAYFLIILTSIVVIVCNVRTYFPTLGDTIRHATFQVGAIITTTGYSTTDFNLWPELPKYILVLLMFCGACAGSTGGGIKVSRILIMLKTVKKEMQTLIHPRSIKRIKMDGNPIEHEVLRSVNVYMVTYLVIFATAILIISLDNFDFETNFTAVAATFNNIGPGLAGVGPMSNFSAYSPLSKLVLSFCMLAGRLEIFPVLMLLYPGTWRKRG